MCGNQGHVLRGLSFPFRVHVQILSYFIYATCQGSQSVHLSMLQTKRTAHVLYTPSIGLCRVLSGAVPPLPATGALPLDMCQALTNRVDVPCCHCQGLQRNEAQVKFEISTM
jgi:hypothetical protein